MKSVSHEGFDWLHNTKMISLRARIKCLIHRNVVYHGPPHRWSSENTLVFTLATESEFFCYSQYRRVEDRNLSEIHLEFICIISKMWWVVCAYINFKQWMKALEECPGLWIRTRPTRIDAPYLWFFKKKCCHVKIIWCKQWICTDMCKSHRKDKLSNFKGAVDISYL